MNIDAPSGRVDPTTLRFLATVGHELRNSLMPVVMLSELLIDAGSLDEMTRDGLRTINASGRLASRLVEDLLDYSRMKHGKFDLHLEPVDVHESIGSVIRSIAPQLSPRLIKVDMNLDASNSEVRGDTERLRQILSNLVINAVKYSYPRGAISIRTWNNDAAKLVVEISDTGIGIGQEDIAHIFEPFYRADHSCAVDAGDHGEGFGLGLAICRLLVERHGGTLEATSPGRGQGTTLRLMLPCAPVTVGRRRASTRPRRSRRSNA